MRTFHPTAEQSARAVQAWQLLISKAMNRQTVTYEDLSSLMYRKQAAGVLSQILGHIALDCEDDDIPPLTAIVVRKRQGKPGDGFPGEAVKVDDARERVYLFDWYNICPPRRPN